MGVARVWLVNLTRLAGAGAVAATLVANAATGGEFQSSLTATVSLSDLSGGRVERVRKGEPFRIEVALKDAATPGAAKAPTLQGWLRPQSPTNVECREAARGFRVTQSLARGATDLNGVVLATLFRDGSFAAIDPKLDLKSSNILAASKFPSPPDAFAVDPRRQTAYFAFREAGTVVAVSLLGGVQRAFASRLGQPSGLLVSARGDVWVAEGESGAAVRFDASGAALGRTLVGSGAPTMLASGDALVAFSPDGKAVSLDPTTGGLRERIDFGAPVSGGALKADGTLVTLDATGESVAIRFLDSPSPAQTLKLRARATSLLAPDAGSLVFATSRDHGGVSVVDIATARQVAGFETRRPVAEAAFTPRFGYFLLDDQSMAFALELASVKMGEELKLRPIPLASNSTGPSTGLGLIAAMPPSDSVLAVSPEAGTAFVLEEMPAFGPAPPMNAVRLRGGVPLAVAVVDRSFRRSAPGRFETYARLDRSGLHELVLTTGVAGMTVCAPVMVDGPPSPEDERLQLALRVGAAAGRLQARTPQSLVLDFVDAEGRQYAIESVELSIPSFASSWAGRVPARRNAAGRLEADVTFPHPGTYAVQPIIPTAARASVTPAIIEVQ